MINKIKSALRYRRERLSEYFAILEEYSAENTIAILFILVLGPFFGLIFITLYQIYSTRMREFIEKIIKYPLELIAATLFLMLIIYPIFTIMMKLIIGFIVAFMAYSIATLAQYITNLF